MVLNLCSPDKILIVSSIQMLKRFYTTMGIFFMFDCFFSIYNKHEYKMTNTCEM